MSLFLAVNVSFRVHVNNNKNTILCLKRLLGGKYSYSHAQIIFFRVEIMLTIVFFSRHLSKISLIIVSELLN